MFASGKSAAVASAANYIEDVFSTYLYTGTGATQTITNGIDLSGKGGLVWMKTRSAAYSHFLADTARGVDEWLRSNTTNPSMNANDSIPAFNSNGFTVGTYPNTNDTGVTFASWTFRKQPKFFDVVTYTGTGSVQNISHNLGSAPACMIVKDTTNAGSAWAIYHTSLGNTQFLQFTTSAAGTSSGYWNNTSPTSTQFTVGTNGNVNQSGATYIAYLFAHNAGGFGLTGTDNVISCGSYTGNGSATGPTVTLGYEPQWVLIKRTDSASGGAWALFDNMRGLTVAGSADPVLYPNSSDAEFTGVDILQPLATGFQLTGTNWNTSGGTYIYIAIRRGPMKVPTSGTSIYNAIAYTKTSTTPRDITGAGFPPDLAHYKGRSGGANSGIDNNVFYDRLRGARNLITNNTNAEAAGNQEGTMLQSGIVTSAAGEMNYETGTAILHFFRRAPSFFDEVCYTGNGTTLTVSHNLGVAPQLMIVKARSIASQNWFTYSETLGNNYALRLDQNYGIDVLGTFPYWNNTTPTSTNFVVNNSGNPQVTNGSGVTYVAYLFATCPGVSKVGSYTGTGALQTVNCGFTSGARFVLIKRTDSTGDWYTYDSTRGITSGNDPYLFLNTTDPEDTGTNYVDTDTTGFKVTAAAPAGLNASGGTYIFLAIA